MLKNNSSANKILKYSGLAFQLFGTVGFFTWIGTILDEKFKFKDPWMTIILVILSFTAVMFWLYNDLKKIKMSNTKFIVLLFITIFINAVLVYLFAAKTISNNYILGMSLIIVFFTIFCSSLFFFGKMTVQSKNKFLFSRVFIISIIFKMIMVILLVLIMIKKFELTTEQIIIPIIFIYISFTTLETISLMKISNKKKLA